MARTTLDVRHGLDLARAKQLARTAAEHYQTRFADRDFQIQWQDDTHLTIAGKMRGASVKAAVEVRPDVLHIAADLPFVLLPFKSVAASAIEREVQSWVQKTSEQA